MRATFLPGGNPIFIAGLGMVKGPLSAVHEDTGFVHVVDDRRAGETFERDGHVRGRFVSHAEAVRLLLGGSAPAAPPDVATPPPVLDPPPAAETTPEWITTAEVAHRLSIHRATLDRMLEQAPSTLVGAPVNVSRGRNRRHLRWNAAELNAWYHAYQEWLGRRGRRR